MIEVISVRLAIQVEPEGYGRMLPTDHMCPQTHALKAGIWRADSNAVPGLRNMVGLILSAVRYSCLKQHRKLGKNKVAVPDAFF